MGCGIPPKPAIDRWTHEITTTLFSNPHSLSGSTSAVHSFEQIQEAKDRILSHFNVTTDEYSVVFVRNCSEGIKFVFDNFEYARLAYCLDNHTSILGLREKVEWKNCKVFEDLCELHAVESGLCAFPLQSNFNGKRYPKEWITMAEDKGWNVLLDVAGYISTGTLDLCQYSPSFVVFSFYKMFGFPTGLGCLLIRNNIKMQKSFFGGGTVNALVADEKWQRVNHFMSDGTLPFLEIASLKHLFDYYKDSFGSFDLIGEHARKLQSKCVQAMERLHHSNGRLLVRLYNPQETTSVINFNLIDSEGNLISYNHVSRLAQESNIHFRTGVFCNAGASMKSLGLTSKEVKENFFNGKVCSDENAFMNGKILGSIRISFGACSSERDVDAFVQFLESNFLIEPVNSPIVKEFTLKGCFIYPIKSCGAMRTEVKAELADDLTAEWLYWDRRFVIVNEKLERLTLTKHVLLNQVKPKITQNWMRIEFEEMFVEFDMNEEGQEVSLSFATGRKCPQFVNDFLTKCLRTKCFLIKLNKKLTNYSDCLLVNEASLKYIQKIGLDNSTLQKVNIECFRANLVVDGIAFAEETIDQFDFEGLSFEFMKKCDRCRMVNVGFEGISKEPLLALTKYRQAKFGVHLRVTKNRNNRRNPLKIISPE